MLGKLVGEYDRVIHSCVIMSSLAWRFPGGLRVHLGIRAYPYSSKPASLQVLTGVDSYAWPDDPVRLLTVTSTLSLSGMGSLG